MEQEERTRRHQEAASHRHPQHSPFNDYSHASQTYHSPYAPMYSTPGHSPYVSASGQRSAHYPYSPSFSNSPSAAHYDANFPATFRRYYYNRVKEGHFHASPTPLPTLHDRSQMDGYGTRADAAHLPLNELSRRGSGSDTTASATNENEGENASHYSSRLATLTKPHSPTTKSPSTTATKATDTKLEKAAVPSVKDKTVNTSKNSSLSSEERSLAYEGDGRKGKGKEMIPQNSPRLRRSISSSTSESQKPPQSSPIRDAASEQTHSSYFPASPPTPSTYHSVPGPSQTSTAGSLHSTPMVNQRSTFSSKSESEGWRGAESSPSRGLMSAISPKSIEKTAARTKLHITPSSGGLGRDMKKLYNSRECADIYFVADGQEIFGHTPIFFARCPPLYALIDEQKQNANAGRRLTYSEHGGYPRDGLTEIVFPNVTFQALDTVLRFVYTDEAELSVSAAVDVLAAASRLEVERLVVGLENLLEQQLSVDNVSWLLQGADVAGAGTLRNKCMEYVLVHFDQVCKTPAFRDLSREIILEVLQRK